MGRTIRPVLGETEAQSSPTPKQSRQACVPCVSGVVAWACSPHPTTRPAPGPQASPWRDPRLSPAGCRFPTSSGAETGARGGGRPPWACALRPSTHWSHAFVLCACVEGLVESSWSAPHVASGHPAGRGHFSCEATRWLWGDSRSLATRGCGPGVGGQVGEALPTEGGCHTQPGLSPGPHSRTSLICGASLSRA